MRFFADNWCRLLNGQSRAQSFIMQILIVEDDFLSRSILKNFLVKMGHTVIEAENGAQAWEILKTKELRIVISDWIMPGFNGLELCEKIRSEPSLEYVYIIMVTAKDHRADLVEVFRAGADDYIPKPFDPDELKARIMTGLRVVDLEERHKLLTRTLFESRNEQRIIIESLEDKIRRLSEQLVETSSRKEAQNSELKNALKRLEDTQSRMIQSETMASIGLLPAGIAHEINNLAGFVSNNLKRLLNYQTDTVGLIEKYHQLISELESEGKSDNMFEGLKKKIQEIKSFEDEIDLFYIMEDITGLISDCRQGTDRIKKIVMDLKVFAHPGEGAIQ